MASYISCGLLPPDTYEFTRLHAIEYGFRDLGSDLRQCDARYWDWIDVSIPEAAVQSRSATKGNPSTQDDPAWRK